jgi:anti-sigma B factor antagonist
MKIKVATEKNVTILSCIGSLDSETLAKFKQATQKLCDNGATRLVLEGGQLTFIDSMGLGALISLLRKVKEHEGDIKVANLTPDVETIFQITRLHRLFDVCDSVDDACAKFKNS